MTVFAGVAAGICSQPAHPVQEPPADERREVLGAASQFTIGRADTHELVAGDRLLTAPRVGADTVVVVPEGLATGLTAIVLERRSTEFELWLRLRWGGQLGWLRAAGSDPTSVVALDDQARRLRRERVAAKARELIGAKESERWSWQIPQLGDSNVVREIQVWGAGQLTAKRRSRLRELTECLPPLHAARFGAMAMPPQLPVEMIVFADRERYLRFTEATTSVVGSETGGFELDGLVVLAVDSDLEVDFLGTAAHELTHALNRLAFPQVSPPPWVEEGMAEDLAHSVEAAYVASAGLCKRPGGWSRTRAETAVVMIDGEAGAETRLTRSARARTLLCYAPTQGVDELLSMDREQFAISSLRGRHYTSALLLVRGLLGEPSANQLDQLVAPTVDEPLQKIVEVLGELAWRSVDRAVLNC